MSRFLWDSAVRSNSHLHSGPQGQMLCSLGHKHRGKSPLCSCIVHYCRDDGTDTHQYLPGKTVKGNYVSGTLKIFLIMHVKKSMNYLVITNLDSWLCELN